MKDRGTLEDTVQAVRARSFPSLPAELVSEILEIEANSHEDRLLARDRVSAAIAAHLKPSAT